MQAERILRTRLFQKIQRRPAGAEIILAVYLDKRQRWAALDKLAVVLGTQADSATLRNRSVRTFNNNRGVHDITCRI